MKKSLYMRKIWQKDNVTFCILWNDEKTQEFRLCDLQRNCPCAHCTDENTGRRLVDPHTIDNDVRAIVIRSVGRYGIRIQFSSGCSMGIYSFDRLRQMQAGEKCSRK